ncbi:MAG: TonB-dependent receptor [Bacteroidales bacterium]|nr:MAG: TonB-dependent receptor [Bacteroidales bacterium]
MKKYLTFLFFLAYAFGYSNPITQTVRGVLTDKLTKTPIPGANVIILNTNPLKGTITDELGRFKVDEVEIGRISIKITFIGYYDVNLTNISLQSGKELVLNIEMEEQVVMGEEIIVKANKDKSVALNKLSMVSARGFTVEETERYAGSRNDVARMASNYAGVVGNNDSRNDIIIRGNSPSGLLWKLDGVDIPNPNHFGATGTTGGPVSMLNNTLLDNSDFFTGAFPAEYGNATAGVFDLKMRNGNNENYEFLGQIGFNGFELGAEGPISKSKGSSFLVNYRYSTLGVMEKMGIDFGTSGIPYYQDLSFKINLPRTRIGAISIFGLGGISDIMLWDSKKDTADKKIDFYGGEGFDLTNGSDMGVIGINHTYLFNDKTYIKTSLSASGHRFATVIDSINPTTKIKSPWYRNNFIDKKILISSFINHKFNSRHSIKSGVELNNLRFNYADSIYKLYKGRFEDIRNTDGSTWLIQPYAQWQFKITNYVTLNIGMHFTYLDLNETSSLEPRLGVRWKASSKSAFSLAYGLHSQVAPLPILFSLSEVAENTYVSPNKNLDLMRSNHFVAGYDYKVNEFTRIKAEAYYQSITKAGVDGNKESTYSILNEGADFGVWAPDTLKSTGTGKNYGVELTIEHFLNKGFYFLITTSIFDSKYKGSNGVENNTAFNNNYIVNGLIGKEFKFNSKSGKSTKSLSLDIKTTYAGGKRRAEWRAVQLPDGQFYQDYIDDNAYSLKLKDYIRTDFRIAFKMNKRGFTQEWGIEITNLFDNKNVYSNKFNKQTGVGSNTYQLGFMMIPQYRIIF